MTEINKEIEEMAEVVIKQIPYDENKLTQDNEYAINLSLAIATALRKVNYQKINGNTSDGYHTFNELYHHRAILFAMVCNQNSDKAWKSKLHSDGTMFDNMFIVGIETPVGQATYHYDIEPYWDYFNVKELDNAPLWDGHTAEQAIERIRLMADDAPIVCTKAEVVKEFAEKVNEVIEACERQDGYDAEGSPIYTIDTAILRVEMEQIAEQYGKEVEE